MSFEVGDKVRQIDQTGEIFADPVGHVGIVVMVYPAYIPYPVSVHFPELPQQVNFPYNPDELEAVNE